MADDFCKPARIAKSPNFWWGVVAAVIVTFAAKALGWF